MKKNELIAQSIKIFNEQRFVNISTIDLVSQLSISEKEFYSHFSDKNELVEEIFFQLCKESDETSSSLDQLGPSLEHLFKATLMSYEVQVKYRFIFLNIKEVIHEHENIKDRYFELLSLRKTQLIHYFWILTKDNTFRDEIIPGQFENLANQMIMLSDFWITHNSILFNIEEFQSKYYAKLVVSIILPYLTEKGIAAYKKELDKFEKNDYLHR